MAKGTYPGRETHFARRTGSSSPEDPTSSPEDPTSSPATAQLRCNPTFSHLSTPISIGATFWVIMACGLQSSTGTSEVAVGLRNGRLGAPDHGLLGHLGADRLTAVQLPIKALPGEQHA